MTNHDRQMLKRSFKSGSLVTEFIDPSNDDRWDEFVEQHPFGWLSHLSSWKNVVEGSFDHMKGYYPALVDAGNGQIKAALPVFEVDSWLTGRKMVSIPWATLSDPLVLCKEEFDLLAGEVKKLSEQRGAKHVEVRTLHTAPLIREAGTIAQQQYAHHYLNLEQDIDQLRRSFHRTCVQQRIRRALNSKLNLRIGETEDDLKILYSMHMANRKSKCLPPQPYRFFQLLWQTLFPENKISLLIAELSGNPIATLLLFKYKDRVSAEIAHMDENYHNVSPNIYLFWQAMLQGIEEGYKIFDFGRTSPTNQSLLAFKSRWGTTVSDISFFYYPQEMSKDLTVEYHSRYRMLKRICKYAPDFALPYIGKFCYRHTG